MHKWVQKVVGWIADALIEKITDPIDDLGKRIDKMSERIDKLEKLHDQDEAARECDLSMMDDRICYLIGMCRKRGYTTADERRRVTRMHDAYRARGGNHGEEVEYAMFCELPSQEEYERTHGGENNENG